MKIKLNERMRCQSDFLSESYIKFSKNLKQMFSSEKIIESTTN